MSTRCHKCTLREELGVLEPRAHPALCNHDGRDESAPFSPISVPRMPPMPGLSWDSNIYVDHNFFGFDLPHIDAGSTLHGALWPAESILDTPQPLCHVLPLLNVPTPSQMRPTHPSCAPAPAMTSCTRHNPLQCVPMRFNAPHPFSMRCHHPRHILHALHMP